MDISALNLGATAPFVGLVGTVAGIVNAFHEIVMAGHESTAQTLAVETLTGGKA